MYLCLLISIMAFHLSSLVWPTCSLTFNILPLHDSGLMSKHTHMQVPRHLHSHTQFVFDTREAADSQARAPGEQSGVALQQGH